MAPKKPLLERMKSNPQSGWTIADVKKLCEQNGVELQNPSNGSHYKAVSDVVHGHLTIPYKRQIKPYYIKSLVEMVEVHNDLIAKKKKEE